MNLSIMGVFGCSQITIRMNIFVLISFIFGGMHAIDDDIS